MDTTPVKPTDLGSLSWCLKQLWRPSQSTAFKKPLLGTGEQFHFFYRYVAAVSSSALYELPRVFHCQIYYIQRNTNIPKLNSEHSIILFCSQCNETTLSCFARDDSPMMFHSNSSQFRASAISLQDISPSFLCKTI